MKRFFATFLIASYVGTACANGLESLETFVKTVSSGRADFTQVVTAPAREGQTARSKTSSGTFAFSRPNRFKFLYQKPFEQSIVADGQTLWLYDADLNQVTARKQSAALGSTPAALIAAAPDLRALQADFTLAAAPEKDGLEWVVATPKAKDGQLQAVRVGFRAGKQPAAQTAELAALEILDSFGQRSVLTFSQVEVNPSLPKDAFQFTSPKGADVIRQ
ncbi:MULTISPECIES: outer membrane lipoprotein chaperone LolA [unclassified Polaromonas]|uniref:outer membrane lipoprotein chaperone LolA n=1 Tax=unclassified Polaromonas TaxID=2638319 RepID=UPI0018CB1F7B|nr:MULTISPECIES: outer membrane lipoprotein chaperone LolA [unclassified Polaromonas]MBG6073053.1 outer membrane lipoprotein carrier protein [Polaromonas sp. CG_9.7]MBG6115058.1 outer membrane lipoprotein carrier protein [Polaromonas sp. CG_9.2]MDH6186019.1 outer membrane lipoprotein carrier protein [Polaromonas sp. CG_23.6]